MSEVPPPTLLSSGNPQIPKGEGEAPVAAYLAAMPGWKSAVGRQIDAIVTETYPDVRKAVKWNTPLYGREDGWFFAMYCYTSYIQLTFFRGTALVPMPPKPSKTAETRYWAIHEGDGLDEAQLRNWIAQAAMLPGVKL